MIHRFLERWELAIRQLVPVMYLLGMVAGTVALFAGVNIGGRLIVGILTGVAVELQTFFQQRQVRTDYALWRTELTDTAARRMRASLYPLIGLLAFQGFNSVVFTINTYHPAPSVVPGWLQIALLGGSVPLLLLLAGFAIPTASNPADMLTEKSREMLWSTMKSVVKQWKSRLRTAESTGESLAQVAKALLEDAGAHADAQRLAIMDEAIPAIGRPKPAPTAPTGKPRRARPAPKRSRDEIAGQRERRLQLLRDELAANPRLTLKQAQEVLGMSNRQGAQNLWHEVRRELGIGRKVAV